MWLVPRERDPHAHSQNLYCVIVASILDFSLPLISLMSEKGFAWMGNTLGEIAGEKAGIFKHGIPAFTVPQPDEAMHALLHRASQLVIHLQVAPPLDTNLLNGLTLGLEGEHQYLNAGLAVALCTTWLQKTDHADFTRTELMNSLPEEFLQGLTTACLQGRAQIVPDPYIDIESPGDLVFYLDGAHSPESMDMCARWFSVSIKKDNQQQTSTCKPQDTSQSSHVLVPRDLDKKARKKSIQILLFNCMAVRDPQLLLPCMIRSSVSHGVHLKKALFVPNTSVYYKVGSHSLPPTDSQVDLSWQLTLQRLWENLVQTNIGGDEKNRDSVFEELRDDPDICARSGENSAVFSCIPLAIKWLRESVKRNQSVQFQVLVTGSLHLVGEAPTFMSKP